MVEEVLVYPPHNPDLSPRVFVLKPIGPLLQYLAGIKFPNEEDVTPVQNIYMQLASWCDHLDDKLCTFLD